MTDYQRVVDELRAFLQGTDQTVTDRLKELAKAYAEVCNEVNQRLRHCAEYLKKGLRGEAIHFAQAEPVLLDVVAVLDFPERATLHDLLLFYGLPELPPLQLDIAQELNQAYAEEQPLKENLLPRHRRLALLRAPVIERLRVMRQIARVDKNNPVWGEDIRLFETARLREIQTAMASPAKVDAAQVEVFARELADPGWLASPPPALVVQVRKRASLLERERARAELGPLVEQLNVATDLADLPQAQMLRDRYRELQAKAQLAANDSLAQRVARPLAWIAQREEAEKRELEVNTVLAVLEDALARQAEPEELGRLHDEALRVTPTLPAHLEQRYQFQVYQVNAARRWREILILLIVFFIGFLLLVGLVGALWVINRTRQVAPAATSRTELTSFPRPDGPRRVDPPSGKPGASRQERTAAIASGSV